MTWLACTNQPTGVLYIERMRCMVVLSQTRYMHPPTTYFASVALEGHRMKNHQLSTAGATRYSYGLDHTGPSSSTRLF